MVLKRKFTKASVGDTYRVRIGGGNGTETVRIRHHSLDHTMSGPGVADYDFTYKGGPIYLYWRTSTGFFAYLSTLYNPGGGFLVDMTAEGPDSPNSYVFDRVDSIVQPLFIERLTQLSTNTSPVTKNSLQ